MPLWIPLTVAAAFLQNLRAALQKRLTATLSTAGATYCRFLYAVPFALAWGWLMGEPLAPGAVGARFAFLCMLGGTAQILGTLALIAAFSHHSFAVATAYSKTETLQTALFGIVMLGDAISPTVAVAIVVSLVGVLALSPPTSAGPRQGIGPILLGIASGTGYAVAAVSYRAASLTLGGPAFSSAAITLAAVITYQAIAMGAYLLLRDRAELARVLGAWTEALGVGVCGMGASVGWFTAMTLENAAHVRALGQVELVFTVAASSLFFRERITSREILGILLVVAGILLLVAGTTA